MLSALEKFLLQSGEGVGKLKGMTIGGALSKGKAQAVKTGKAVKESPRAALAGVGAGAGAGYGLSEMNDPDEAEKQRLRAILAALQSGQME